jgi:hypothetical protein
MKKLIARAFGLTIPTEPVVYVARFYVYAVSSESTDVELARAIEHLGSRMKRFLEQDPMQHTSPIGTLTHEGWDELHQLASLWTAAKAERERRDSLVS